MQTISIYYSVYAAEKLDCFLFDEADKTMRKSVKTGAKNMTSSDAIMNPIGFESNLNVI